MGNGLTTTSSVPFAGEMHGENQLSKINETAGSEEMGHATTEAVNQSRYPTTQESLWFRIHKAQVSNAGTTFRVIHLQTINRGSTFFDGEV